MQLRAPFAVKNKHANNRREGQDGIKRRGGSGDFTDVHHLMADVLFLIEVALPEEMRHAHAENSGDGDWQCGFEGEVNQRHFRGFRSQHHVTGSRGENNRRRRGANSRRCATADPDVNHYRE